MARVLLAASVCLLVAACAPGNGSSVTGLVVDVQGDLTNVTEFTVLTEAGERLVLTPAGDGDFAFPLPHLRDHLRSGEPVRVGYEDREGTLVATAIDDAQRSHRLP